MLLELQSRLAEEIRAAARRNFDVELTNVSFSYPPRLDMGDLAITAPFDLAKSLKKKPREIGRELAAALPASGALRKADVAGGGYVNLFLDRAAFARELHRSLVTRRAAASVPGAVIVEHTSINPNKAAHIGHVRNAVIGDTFVRILRSRGRRVGIQNYIDDTGVQVADVVVGFSVIENKTLEDVRQLGGRFDYYCWDLYAKVGDFYAQDKDHKRFQIETLHAIEKGGNPTAALAEHVAARIVDCHLATMERLGIRYDLLAHESDILRLHFWDRAFELLKESGAIRLESEGKNAGCWVLAMGAERDSLPAGENVDETEPSGGKAPGGEAARMAKGDRIEAPAKATSARPGRDSLPAGRHVDEVEPSGGRAPGGEAARIDDDKIIVRSNGTVTYTGKDIAYQLWKLGRLDRDFRYRRHRSYPDGHVLWTSTSGDGEAGAPVFGHARAVYNVIDVGQSYPQRVVKAGVAALGHGVAADASHHLAYEKVVLSPATARALGYDVDEEAAAVKVSGRKGLGVKADDLIDALEKKALAEIETRDPERPTQSRERSARAIAVGALRYFLLKFGRNRIITFDMDEALAFVGETGPYIQNSIVRARSIFGKLAAEGHELAALLDKANALPLERFLDGEEGDEVWSLLMLMARSEEVAEQVVASEDSASLAKHAFALAQAFHAYYQKPKYSLLHAESDELRAFRVLVVDAFVRQMEALAELLGIPVPERM